MSWPLEFLESKEVTSAKSVEAALGPSGWLGVATFVYESNGWTVIEDLSGGLGDIPAEKWLGFAGQDDLIVAGYNDAIPYGELVVISGGKLVRSFLQDKSDSNADRNIGKLPDEDKDPIKTWVDVAGRVDEDQIVAGQPDFGTLLLFKQ